MVILDWIKGVSIFCIIINHTDLLGRGIPVSHILNCLIVAMAVPMFMMVSGYNMMNAQINNGENAGGGVLYWRFKASDFKNHSIIYIDFLNGDDLLI